MKKVIIAVLLITLAVTSISWGAKLKFDLDNLKKLGINLNKSYYILSGGLTQLLVLEKKIPSEYSVYLISTFNWKKDREFKIPVKLLNAVRVNKDFTKAFILSEAAKTFAILDLDSGKFASFYERKRGIPNNFYPIPPYSCFFVDDKDLMMYGALYDEKGNEIGSRIARINTKKQGWDAFSIVCNMDEVSGLAKAKYPNAQYMGVSFGKSQRFGFLYGVEKKKHLFIFDAEKKTLDEVDKAGDILGYTIDANGKRFAYIKGDEKSASLNLYLIDSKEKKTIEEGLFVSPIFSPSGEAMLVIRGTVAGNQITYDLCWGDAKQNYKLKKIQKIQNPEVVSFDFKSAGKDFFLIEEGKVYEMTAR